MARTGEAVCLDGLAARVQRPRGWANQKVLYDAKRHTHTAQGLTLSTIHGALLWMDGGWRGLPYRVRDVFRAAGALICLGRWLPESPHERASRTPSRRSRLYE
jgi:hypothetical protein